MWSLLVAVAAHAEVIDRVVAVVDDRPLLASEIALQADLARLDPHTKWAPGAGDPTAWAIDGARIRSVAERVSLYDPSDEEVRARIEGLRDVFTDRGAWTAYLTRHGLDEIHLDPFVRRQLVVERYLLRNVPADPADPQAWAAAVDAFLAPLRERVPARIVPPATP
jgi:hypothetical protein